ncbi:MAG: hypothetical protein AVDCRST_MAG38-3010, partial [uncultured Solirubrobacteraceae bacterium]
GSSGSTTVGEGAQGVVRGLLLPLQHALRAVARRALRHLPSGSSGGTAPAAPDALRVPAGAPAPGRVGLPHRRGAGGAARL